MTMMMMMMKGLFDLVPSTHEIFVLPEFMHFSPPIFVSGLNCFVFLYLTDRIMLLSTKYPNGCRYIQYNSVYNQIVSICHRKYSLHVSGFTTFRSVGKKWKIIPLWFRPCVFFI